MAAQLTVGFLGNCQAQFFESWTLHLSHTLRIISFPPIWLVPADQVDHCLSKIAECDYLFAQRLGDDFSLAELRTATLKERFGDKIVSWPNIYFDGYFPGVGYRYRPGGGKIEGPLDDYHWDVIEQCFHEGLPAESAVDILQGAEVEARYPSSFAVSLGHLCDRETQLDVTISDFLAWRVHVERLFYSMNHPTNAVMSEMLYRLFGHVNEQTRLTGLGPFGYPLDKIILPILPAIARRYGMEKDSDVDSIKGSGVKFSSAGYALTGETKYYGLKDLVDCFYRVYEIEKDAGTTA